tara:strand:- start:147 stop:647 length:501 start_codon:yes stop_codon:yes gene_type:complete
MLKQIDKFNLLQTKNLVSLLIVIFIFIFDRITKIKIINHQLSNPQIFINDFVNLNLVWNTGIGFGLLSSQTNLIYNLISAVIFIIILFIIYIIVKSKFVDKILFSLILGGAIGNFYDRLAYFAVPDFIDLHYQNFHWFTFNIADIFITIGILIIICKELFYKNETN